MTGSDRRYQLQYGGIKKRITAKSTPRLYRSKMLLRTLSKRIIPKAADSYHLEGIQRHSVLTIFIFQH
jgi:hypothetical protein